MIKADFSCGFVVEQEWISGRVALEILFVCVIVGLSAGKNLPHSLRNIFLKGIFFRNYRNYLYQHF